MIHMSWSQGECGECGDKMKVIGLNESSTCKQCRVIEALDKIASILEGHLGWS